MKKALILEDDINLGTTLAGTLEMQDYKVLYLTCIENALNEIKLFSPDIIILDVMLNGSIDGFELARQIRLEKDTPILFTTSKDGSNDLLEGFSIPNTDYIRKPYKHVEVTLRMNNLLAIHSNKVRNSSAIQIGSFCFNSKEQSLKFELDEIQLSASETSLMNLLCDNIGKFMKRDVIVKTIWNEDDSKLKESTLNNITSNLRKYLRKDDKIILESRLGLGVRLILETEKA
jgi:DNA-binding response OmpR family regulator